MICNVQLYKIHVPKCVHYAYTHAYVYLNHLALLPLILAVLQPEIDFNAVQVLFITRQGLITVPHIGHSQLD